MYLGEIIVRYTRNYKVRRALSKKSASLPIEVGNALSAMFKRGRLSLDQAEVALEAFQRIPIQLVEIDLEASLALAYDLDIYAYDAYMLDCAKRHRSPLLTLDEGLRNAATKAEIKVLEVEE